MLVAFDRTAAPLEVPILLSGVVLAGLIAFVLVITLGDIYLEAVGRLSYWKLSSSVLAVLLALAYLFTGVTGIAIFVAATVVGMVPIRLGCRRVHLMGVLIGPLLVGL